MGSELCGHLVLAKPDLKSLEKLSPDLGYRVFHHKSKRVWYIETFRQGPAPGYPLSTLSGNVVMAKGLQAEARPYAQAIAVLARRRYSDPHVHGHLNIGVKISKLLSCPVFSFASNDDGFDVASVCDSGRIKSIRSDHDDLRLDFSGGRLTITPFIPEEQDRGVIRSAATELSRLAKTVVLERTQPASLDLHDLIRGAMDDFMGRSVDLLGLADEEADLNSALKVVASRVKEVQLVRLRPSIRGTPAIGIDFILRKYVEKGPGVILRQFPKLPTPVPKGEAAQVGFKLRDAVLILSNARLLVYGKRGPSFTWWCDLRVPPVMNDEVLIVNVPGRPALNLVHANGEDFPLSGVEDIATWILRQHAARPKDLKTVNLVHSPHCRGH